MKKQENGSTPRVHANAIAENSNMKRSINLDINSKNLFKKIYDFCPP